MSYEWPLNQDKFKFYDKKQQNKILGLIMLKQLSKRYSKIEWNQFIKEGKSWHT